MVYGKERRGESMKYLALILVLLAGCATASVETKGKGPDASTCKASYNSAFKSLSDIEMKACNAYGSAGTSNVDPAFVELIRLLSRLTTPVAP